MQRVDASLQLSVTVQSQRDQLMASEEPQTAAKVRMLLQLTAKHCPKLTWYLLIHEEAQNNNKKPKKVRENE